jgi:hypothetical protein
VLPPLAVLRVTLDAPKVLVKLMALPAAAVAVNETVPRPALLALVEMVLAVAVRL